MIHVSQLWFSNFMFQMNNFLILGFSEKSSKNSHETIS